MKESSLTGCDLLDVAKYQKRVILFTVSPILLTFFLVMSLLLLQENGIGIGFFAIPFAVLFSMLVIAFNYCLYKLVKSLKSSRAMVFFVAGATGFWLFALYEQFAKDIGWANPFPHELPSLFGIALFIILIWSVHAATRSLKQEGVNVGLLGVKPENLKGLCAGR
jgi:hypothetical protein